MSGNPSDDFPFPTSNPPPPQPPRRPSLDDVAQAAGVGKSTAARALKGDKHVARKTSKVVLEAAQKLGYQPDPVLSSLARERWRSRDNFTGTTVALVHYPAPEVSYPIDFDSVGIHYVAQSRGYRVEKIDASEYADSLRLAQVLECRNYRGLILGPMHCPPDWLQLNWASYALVAYGSGSIHQLVDCVALDFLGMTRLALRRARESGYQRIGFALVHEQDTQSRDEILAACSLETPPGVVPIPPHVGPASSPDSFYRWFHQYQPDAVVSNRALPLIWLTTVGLRIPGDVAFACLELQPENPSNLTGFAFSGDKLGRRAMELLDHSLCTNTRGLPEFPARLTLTPLWNSGTTLART
jgi:LacI family transcriptional regulator